MRKCLSMCLRDAAFGVKDGKRKASAQSMHLAPRSERFVDVSVLCINPSASNLVSAGGFIAMGHA